VKGASLANAIAFAAILGARLAGKQGHILYIAPDRFLHPLGLLPYAVKLDRLFHVSARRSRDLAWAVMEALRCPQVSSVMAVLSGLNLTESRRLQLAAETSGATGFLLSHAASQPVASAITRWKISPVIGKSGQRFDQPLWMAELSYCRGGRPGKWLLEWHEQKLNSIRTQPLEQTAREALAG
jgi:protein ImuA